MFLLDLACKPISESFGHGVYHVGTSAERKEYRDVDVRLMLSDKKHDKLRKAVGAQGIAFMGLAFGQYLASLTDLPIDFQIQRQTEANYHHSKRFRNPLGVRTLDNFTGDAPDVEEEVAEQSKVV
jgi:hypothetical protein